MTVIFKTCKHCGREIKNVKNPRGDWMHTRSSRAVCLTKPGKPYTYAEPQDE